MKTLSLFVLLLSFSLMFSGCTHSVNPEEQLIFQDLQKEPSNSPEFLVFLQEQGEALQKSHFVLEDIGIPIPQDSELGESFYDDVIVGLSRLASRASEKDRLVFFLHHPNEGVRSEVAKNEHLTEDLQKNLLYDSSDLVRAYLAANTKLSSANAALLSGDPSEMVRRPLAQNPALSLELMTLFVTDANPEVQRGLARNKNLSRDIMAMMVEKSADAALSDLIKRSDLPSDLLEKLRKTHPHLFSEL